MEKEDVLELIEKICMLSPAESIDMDGIAKRKVSEREKDCAKAINAIYRAAHSFSKTCTSHAGWREEAEETAKKLKDF